MFISNQDIAALLSRMAVLLELEGANVFRVRAYQNAAALIDKLPHNLADSKQEDKALTGLPGIGKDLAGKINEIIQRGSFRQLEELEARLPKVLLELIKIPGLGPKRARALWDNLSLQTVADLKAAAGKGKIRGLSGFGPKLEEQILQGIAFYEANPLRTLWADAENTAHELCSYLKQIKTVAQVEAAGSFRRKKETVGDLDILAVCPQPELVMQTFLRHPHVEKVISHGSTRSSVILRSGLQVDLRVVLGKSFGAALHYFTGSQAHNIALRKLAQQQNLKLNEYGVFRGERQLAGKTEAEVYQQLGLPYIPPELREMTGELEAAAAGKLPDLITLNKLRGDLHCHTSETDGALSLEELALAAQDLGYEYLGITDHSQHVTIAAGMDEKRLRRQLKAIDQVNAKHKDIVLLKGIEVDIMDNGKLDLPDSVLKELDFTVCSIHSKFNLPEARQTERILRAMDNPLFTVFGHPSGRLIGTRPGYAVNMEKIVLGAKERGCFLELNAHPQRLDLTEVYCRLAKETGVLVAISSDAHSRQGLDALRYGINQARRGWLEARDVLNTRPLGELRKLFKR
jgi:DNA polymerase (family 10)